MSYKMTIVIRVMLAIVAVLALIGGLYYSGFSPEKMTPAGMKADRAKARAQTQTTTPVKAAATPTPVASELEDFSDSIDTAPSDATAARKTVDFLFDDKSATDKSKPVDDSDGRFTSMKERLEAIAQDADK